LAVEALGSCTAIKDTYPTNVPTLIVAGDQLDRTKPKPFGMDACFTTAQTHSNMTVWWLPNLGINGNSHMMMLDKNNEQVWKVLEKYIDKTVKTAGGRDDHDDDHGHGGHDNDHGHDRDNDRDNDHGGGRR
jgi:hypothetical protein